MFSLHSAFMRPTKAIPLVLVAARTLGTAFALFLLYALLYHVHVFHRHDFPDYILHEFVQQDLRYIVFLILVMLPYKRMHPLWLWAGGFVPLALLCSLGLVMMAYHLRRYPWYAILYVALPTAALFVQVGVIWAIRYSTIFQRYLVEADDRTKKTERLLVSTLVSICMLTAVSNAVYIAAEPIKTGKPTMLMRKESLGPDYLVDSAKVSILTKLFCQADYFLDDEIERYNVPFLMHIAVSQDGNTLYYVFAEPSATDSYIIYRVKVGTFLPIEKWYDGGA